MPGRVKREAEEDLEAVSEKHEAENFADATVELGRIEHSLVHCSIIES